MEEKEGKKENETTDEGTDEVGMAKFAQRRQDLMRRQVSLDYQRRGDKQLEKTLKDKLKSDESKILSFHKRLKELL